MNKVNNIFEHTNCLSEEMLTKYVSGKLSSAQKHEVEKHLVDCEMCSDAAEGLAMIADKGRVQVITSELNRKIREKTDKRKMKIVFLGQYRMQMSVAASLVLLVGLVWFFRSNMTDKELDPSASQKIFADKFEPYKEDEESGEIRVETEHVPTAPVELPAATKEMLESNSFFSNDSVGELKASADNLQQRDDRIAEGEEGGQSAEGYYSKLNDKQVAVPAEPKVDKESAGADLLDRTETFKGENEAVKTEEKAVEQSVQTGSTVTFGTAPVAGSVDQSVLKKESEKDKKKKKDELAGKQRTRGLFIPETKSKADKDGSKATPRENKVMEDRKSVDLQTAKPQKVGGETNNSTKTELTTDIPAPVMQDSVVAFMWSADNYRNRAMERYEQKDFRGAIADFERTLSNEPGNYNALFYSAISYLSTGETDKAVANLNKVLENKEGEFYDAAQWYLSLAYIKKNDPQNARKILTELRKNTKSKYHKQAEETLEMIRK